MMNMSGAPAQMPMQAAPPMPPPPPPPQPVDPTKLADAQELLRKPTWDDVITLFRDDRLRSFKIDIETDSTISADEQGQKQAVTEFVSMLGGFLTQASQIIQQEPETAQLVMETMKYATRQFKAGRQMETVIDETADRILAKLKNAPPAPMDPKVEAAQMMAQAKIQQGQAQLQIEREKTAAQVELKHQEAAANMGLRQAQAQADAQLEIAKATTDAQIAAVKAQNQPHKVV
jgi:hypothetical protein